jgi:hypothetical protein
VAVFVGVSVGVLVGTGVFVGIGVFVGGRVFVGIGVFVGYGVRVFVGRPKLKVVDDDATLLRNVAPVAPKLDTSEEFKSITVADGTDTGTSMRHVVK